MTIKKRNIVSALSTNDVTKEIEKFAAGAEGSPVSSVEVNQTAIRDYKAIRVPFNQYEYEQLEIGARLSGRSKLNFIRYAMLRMVKELQQEQG
jgi:hypothetical protein